LLEISLVDAHFGKYAWARETGNDYDLEIAEHIFSNAVDDILCKSAGYPIERIVLTVGSDFLHTDNQEGTTTHGTRQDTDGRLAKVVETGEMAMVRAIDRCLQVAPVLVKLVPGNHDYTTSFHTARFLQAWYRNCPDVEVDCEPTTRKYLLYGKTLIGWTHGCSEKMAALPNIMAMEQKQAWAQANWYEWHIGHLHKKGEVRFTSVDSHEGVVVRRLPSLTARDAWHYLMGYIGDRMAEAYLYSRDRGPTGYFITTAQETTA
jgi:hypothetical protein